MTGKNLREKPSGVVPVHKIKRAKALLSEVSIDLQKNATRNFYNRKKIELVARPDEYDPVLLCVTVCL